MTRVNLLIDPSLRSGTTSAYTPTGGAGLSYNEDYAFYGAGSLQVTKTGSLGQGVRVAAPIPVIAQLPYAFSVYGRIPVEIPNMESAEILIRVEWINSLGEVVGTNQSAALLMDDDSTWYRVGGVWTAPVGSTAALMYVLQPLAGSNGSFYLLDAFQVTQSTYLGGYFDNISVAEKNHIATKALTAMPQVINGLRLGADVEINDHILNTIDENDTIWVCTGLDGWFGQTTPVLPDIPRGTDDGSHDVEGRLTSRTITLEGFFIPKNPDEALSEATDRLVSAINLVRKGGWLITHAEPSKASWVRLSGRPEIVTENDRGRTSFSIPLRAGDPNKYHWNDADPEGYTNVTFEASDPINYAENIGTANVSGVFRFSGPAGAGTRVYNALTDQIMTLMEPLRGAGAVANATSVEATNGVATIYTSAPHGLLEGDEVTLLNMVIPFSESNQTRTLTHVSDVYPYSISFEIATDDIDLMNTGGTVYLKNNDVLEVDTYNKTVKYNNNRIGQRFRLTTLTDWIHFGPGTNPIEFHDEVTQFEVVSKALSGNQVTLRTATSHQFIPGEEIHVELPTEKSLSKKSLTGNVVTLTTAEPHGFAVGDTVNVESTESSLVVNKSRTSNVSTLTTQDTHGISVSDQVTVALPVSSIPSNKSLTSNVATITTANAHGYSVGDSVTVALPTAATISSKSLTSNVATIGTTAAHRISVGDSVTVSLPVGSNVVGKARDGARVVITTAGAHGMSTGDTVVMTLPTSATITGTRSINGTTNLVTLNTSAAHNFSVGDKIQVSVGTVATRTVTNRSATATHCTLTLNATHSWVVGEKVTVSGVTSRYNGTFYITSVAATTITYANAGSTESSTASGGTALNVTIDSYYNGTKIIETVPTTTSLTYRAWDQEVTTSSTALSGPTLTNLTNTSYNGTKTIVSGSGTTFAYNL